MADPVGRVAPRGVLPRAALTFLRRKRLAQSDRWTSVWREEHAAAFTVAQLLDLDLLADTHRALVTALRKGETFETFRSGIEPLLRARGWAPSGRGGSVPRRLRRIFDTNLRTARAAGRWDRIQRTAELLPYLLYTLGPSRVHREDHQAWAGVCLPADHEWWRTHYPPNGWGCKCATRQVAAPPEGAQTTAPPGGTVEWIDPVTRRAHRVPEGIDPGWDFNAGQHRTAGVNGALTRRLEQVLSGRPAADDRARRVRPLLEGASDAARERLARRIVERHVGGPAFRWFAERKRGATPMTWRARPSFIETTPVGVMPPERTRTISAPSQLVVINERVMHKQQRHHPEMDGSVYTLVQAALDGGALSHADRPGRWLFDLPQRQGRIVRVVVEVADDRPSEVVSVYHQTPKKKRKGRVN